MSRVQAFIDKARRHLADHDKDVADGVFPCRMVMIETEDVRALVEAISPLMRCYHYVPCHEGVEVPGLELVRCRECPMRTQQSAEGGGKPIIERQR